MNLPKLSIAARLYAIFALMALTTVALSMVAVSNARYHAALTDEFESANAGSWNVERINSLIYATVMESRGIYMSADTAEATKYADGLLKVTDQISGGNWRAGSGAIRNSDAPRIQQLCRPHQWISGRFTCTCPDRQKVRSEGCARMEPIKIQPSEILHCAQPGSPATLSEHYSDTASQLYTQIDEGIDHTAMLLTALAGIAVVLALIGVAIIARSITKPITGNSTSVTRSCRGKGDSAIFHSHSSDRGDEIGGLARSIGVFQNAMRNNEELNRTVLSNADLKAAIDSSRCRTKLPAVLHRSGKHAG